MGRKNIPTKLKLIKGTDRADRMIDEAKPDPAIPSPPECLDQVASVEWGRVANQLFKLGLLSDIDKAALGGYCAAYSRWDRAEKEIQKSGMLIKTTNGNIIQNPYVGIANQALMHMHKFLIEFGMTPAARTKISVKTAEKEDDQFGKFKK